MGWHNEHLHMFKQKKLEIGPAEDDAYDERSTELWAVVPKARGVLQYLYDFGDSWTHDIAVEEVYEVEDPRTPPRCLAGRRAGPPEDCGGIYGLGALLDRRADEDEDEDDWGETYDPAKFSIAEVNAALVRAFAAPTRSRRAERGGVNHRV